MKKNFNFDEDIFNNFTMYITLPQQQKKHDAIAQYQHEKRYVNEPFEQLAPSLLSSEQPLYLLFEHRI